MFVMIRRGDWAPHAALAATLAAYGVAYSIDQFSAPMLVLVFLAIWAGTDRDQAPTSLDHPDAASASGPRRRRVVVGAAARHRNVMAAARLRASP
jgi:hypothetical protein